MKSGKKNVFSLVLFAYWCPWNNYAYWSRMIFIFLLLHYNVLHNSLWQYLLLKVLFVLNATVEDVQENKLILLSQASKTA